MVRMHFILVQGGQFTIYNGAEVDWSLVETERRPYGVRAKPVLTWSGAIKDNV